MAKLGIDRGRTRMGIGEASAGTASDARKGVARVMQPGIYSTGGNILRDLDRVDTVDQAFWRAVANPRAQRRLFLEISPLTSVLDLHWPVPAMSCQSERRDLVMAREALPRICSGTPFCKVPSCL
jgi:hypothetical protein